MPDLLLLYASSHGHTAKIASRIAEALRGDGVTVHIHDAASAPDVAPSGFDGVIVGGSVHAGNHQRSVADWVERHRTSLAAMPTAFFSVSLTAADDSEESRRATRDYIDDFMDGTGWTPRRTASFAGALQYREYDFMTRLIMRVLMRRGEHPTDTTRDYEYTDWEAVERFAHDCAKLLA
jgi:menaquinone-dependent protoporphyrinogen oxidase